MKTLFTFVLLTFGINAIVAQSVKKDSLSSKGFKLNLEYNVMDDIRLKSRSRYKNTKNYKFIEEGIYLDLKATDSFRHRITISYVLLDNTTNDQYPLEDILDKYLVYVSHEFKTLSKDKFKIELGGDLEDLQRLKKELIGKKVFNRDYEGEDGKIYVDLVIE